MKIRIEVEAVMEKCQECPRMELETIKTMSISIHRCKHAQVCREVIRIWEEDKHEG